ncbi:protein SPMIP2 [Clarias gariepinus]|uniref:uncharacterized protein C4orf45 homolog n=1 Tax=Clarias gariepinus TaxID=13013 RepID=UPI00234D8879|nr:uncharacterized protein C4orf45 homolog [Clarias gariepinus]
MREKQSRTNPAQKAAGKRILFTGPGGVKDYHITLCDFPHSIGIGPLPSGATGDLNYLLRPAPDAPPPLPKHCYVGEVGWGIEHGVKLNTRTLLSNTQIKRSGFNLAMEDRISQIIQETW